MNGTLFAFVVLLLALGATYFFCVRPMRKGSGCAMGQAGSRAGAACKDQESGTEAARLKAEIAALQAQSARPGPE